MSSSADRVAALVELLVDALDLDATVTLTEKEGSITATIEGEDLGLAIGRHGQTIDAVQHLAQRTALDDGPDGKRPLVVVDAGGYRERRREALERLGDDAADEAVERDEPVSMDAMGAGDRRIVHEHLRDRDDVETRSEGDEPRRHVVVAPADR